MCVVSPANVGLLGSRHASPYRRAESIYKRNKHDQVISHFRHVDDGDVPLQTVASEIETHLVPCEPWRHDQIRPTRRADRCGCVNANLTDADLNHIAALPDLRAVKLSKQPITDAGLKKLLLLTKLKSLGLDETRITDAGMAGLEKLPAWRNFYWPIRG